MSRSPSSRNVAYNTRHSSSPSPLTDEAYVAHPLPHYATTFAHQMDNSQPKTLYPDVFGGLLPLSGENSCFFPSAGEQTNNPFTVAQSFRREEIGMTPLRAKVLPANKGFFCAETLAPMQSSVGDSGIESYMTPESAALGGESGSKVQKTVENDWDIPALATHIWEDSLERTGGEGRISTDKLQQLTGDPSTVPWSNEKIRTSSKRPRKPICSKAQRRSMMVKRRNPDVEEAMEKLDAYDYDGTNLRKKLTVELDDKDFLLIVCILQSTKTGAVFVRGHVFRRTRHMNGMFNNKRNEVCWIQEIDNDDHRPSEVQSMETVAVTQIVKRRGLRLTNLAYPALNYYNDKSWTIPHDKDPNKKTMYAFIENNAPLTCRIKFVRYFKDARARRKNACHEQAVYFLREDECGNGTGVHTNDLQLRQTWRGSTEYGGAQVGMVSGEKEFLRQETLSHAGKPCSNSLLIAGRKYEPGDVMTRGTVGDILIANADMGVIYQKLSGVNNKCFTRSTFNVVTGEEVSDSDMNNTSFTTKITDARHAEYIGGEVFRFENGNPRTEAQSSQFPRAPAEPGTDACWTKISKGLVYQHQDEGEITDTMFPRFQETQKRTASDTFPYSAKMDRMSVPGFHKHGNDPHRVRLTEAETLLSSRGELHFGDTTMLRPYNLTRLAPSLSAPLIASAEVDGKRIRQHATPCLNNSTPPMTSSQGDAVRRGPQTRPRTKHISRRYTFGDCFCGTGGMSRGAVMAGLRVKWGFDFNDIACYSYALNFVGASVYHEQANSFATSRADQKVDICHLSPPCQYFSPAHTRPGRGDEDSTASFFAVGELLQKTKCRIAVLEQTAGLVNRHERYFHSCVREFVERGFSVRWRVINCADYGLPQRRTRLFMIASWYA